MTGIDTVMSVYCFPKPNFKASESAGFSRMPAKKKSSASFSDIITNAYTVAQALTPIPAAFVRISDALN
ncbi:MAG: hypothetical protein LBS53_14000 [Synergistaceae bacterium]|jgi:hypothetical protein|nr:hypothetical protein [Synergistaceae bacterium]